MGNLCACFYRSAASVDENDEFTYVEHKREASQVYYIDLERSFVPIESAPYPSDASVCEPDCSSELIDLSLMSFTRDLQTTQQDSGYNTRNVSPQVCLQHNDMDVSMGAISSYSSRPNTIYSSCLSFIYTSISILPLLVKDSFLKHLSNKVGSSQQTLFSPVFMSKMSEAKQLKPALMIVSNSSTNDSVLDDQKPICSTKSFGWRGFLSRLYENSLF